MKLIATIQQYDTSMFIWCMARKHLDQFRRLSRWISRSGDGYLYALLGIGLHFSGIPEHHLFLYTALIAFLIERPLYFVLKNGLRRNRPQEALQNFRSFIIPSDKFSFPSGHTSAAFVMATLAGYFYPSLLLPGVLWAALVGLSRIFLGVHFPTDILVGMVMGVGIACASLRIFIA